MPIGSKNKEVLNSEIVSWTKVHIKFDLIRNFNIYTGYVSSIDICVLELSLLKQTEVRLGKRVTS